MLRDRGGPRRAWADLQDTPPSQHSQPEPSPAEDLVRCSQASQESADQDGSREILRAQLELTRLDAALDDTVVASEFACTVMPLLPEDFSGPAASSSSVPTAARCVGTASSSSSGALRLHDSASDCRSPEVRRGGTRQWQLHHLQGYAEAMSAKPAASDPFTPPRVPKQKRSQQKPLIEGSKRVRSGAFTAASGATEQQSRPGPSTPARPRQDSVKPKENSPDEKREHRRAGVEAVKRSPEYQASLRHRAEDARFAAPPTPDSEDLSTSKRGWESKVKEWRDALKQSYSSSEQEPIEEF